ncbi:MAG: type II toxin-antitoxin system PrlF family antitoxin [Chloroflexi bacterium]|nr:type II toxin-antitoxin system PrlF family antitoxin [Chloroflexota bacterium]
MEKTFFRSRLRNKGQVTVPAEIRTALGAREGDDLIFFTDEQGQVLISRAQIIPPDQAWFWSERWQRLERAAQADLDAERVVEFPDVDDAIRALEQIVAHDAED